MGRAVAAAPRLLARRSPFLLSRSTFPAIRSFSSSAVRREDERKWSTPLAKQLFEAISVRYPHKFSQHTV